VNDSPPPATATLSLHDALPIWLLLKWALAWLVAEALLLTLAIVLYRRIVNQRQHRLSHQRQVRQRKRLLKRAQKIAQLLPGMVRSEEHTSELQSRENLVCRLLL